MKSDAGPVQARQYAGIARTAKDKLAQAGYRGQAPLIAFMFFRFVMPFIVFVVTLFYLFVVTAFPAGRRMDESRRPPLPARCSAIICPTCSSPT